MSDVKAMVDSAVAALKAGKKSEARTTLTQAVDLDPKNEQAWLYLSALVTSLEEQEICLENVLTINPNNDRAQKALGIVLEKQGKPPKSAAPPPTPPPAPMATSDGGWGDVNSSGGGAGWGDIDVANWDDLVSSVTPDDPPPVPATPSPAATSTSDTGNADWLAGIETNPWQTNEDDPAISGSWDFAADPIPDSDPMPTSVEWGGDSVAAAHGSGLNVEQPSPEQYDSWISGMNLGTSPDSSPASEPIEETSNFSGFEEATATTGEKDPFDTSNWSDGWTTPGIEGEADNFFEDSVDEGNENPFVEDFSISSLDPEPASSDFDGFRQVDESSDSADSNDLSDFSFDFSDDDSTFTKAADVDEDFLALDFIDEIEEATGAQKMNLSQYFAQIPDEIDVKIKTGGGGTLGILLLLLMNIAAVIGLVIQTG